MPPDDIAFVQEDSLTGNELRQPAEELGRERLGAVDRVRFRDNREHGLQVRGP